MNVNGKKSTDVVTYVMYRPFGIKVKLTERTVQCQAERAKIF